MFFSLCAAGVLIALLRVGIVDWRHQRIGNSDVLLIALGSSLCFALSAPLDFAGLIISFAAALALTLPGFALGQVGGGDVKLLCALAPLWHAVELLSVFVCGVLLMGPMWFLTASISGRKAALAPLPLGTTLLLGALPWFFRRLLNHG